jgi:hypothetical protein
MTAMAARPGAVDSAYIVGSLSITPELVDKSSFVEVEANLLFDNSLRGRL